MGAPGQIRAYNVVTGEHVWTFHTVPQPGEYGYGQGNEDIRRHDPPREMVSLEDYRRRHAQYKLDPDLHHRHLRHPGGAVWDAHAFAGDVWGVGAPDHDPDEDTVQEMPPPPKSARNNGQARPAPSTGRRAEYQRFASFT